MILPKGFQFSQGSLQDYCDCRRRFLLRYVHHLAWPAVETEPLLESEQYALQGKQFHKMIQQHLVGIPPGNISAMGINEELLDWWQNYLDYYQRENFIHQKALHPELSLSSPIRDHRLVATFDLILSKNDGTLMIFDWKTNRRRPQRIWLEQRLQTRVYPYLLTIAGSFLIGSDRVVPEDISMIYWFANFPEQPEIFIYNSQSFSADRSYIKNLIEEISLADEKSFTMTPIEKRCQFCVYRSLCERGVQAGNWNNETEEREDLNSYETDIPLDFDQIGEIAF